MFARYYIESQNGKPTIDFEKKVVNTFTRGSIYTDKKEFVCKGPDMPIEVSVNDFQVKKYLEDYYNFIFCNEVPFNQVQIIVVNLLDSFGKIQTFVTTNQKINAGESRFDSKLATKASEMSHGLLFENCLGEFYKQYMNDFGKLPFKTRDVWWICPSERSSEPFSGDVAKFGFRIDGNDVLDPSPRFEQFNSITEFVLNEDEPMSFTCGYIPKATLGETQSDATVNNTLFVKFVNDRYSTLQKALNNEPDVMKRIFSLSRFMRAKPAETEEYYATLSRNVASKKRGDRHRTEEMSREIAIQHLRVLSGYNPTMFYVSLILFTRLTDRVLENYYSGAIGQQIWASFSNELRKLRFVDREVVGDVLLMMKFDVDTIVEKMKSEMGYMLVNTFSRESVDLKRYLFNYANVEVVKKLFGVGDEWFSSFTHGPFVNEMISLHQPTFAQQDEFSMDTNSFPTLE